MSNWVASFADPGLFESGEVAEAIAEWSKSLLGKRRTQAAE